MLNDTHTAGAPAPNSTRPATHRDDTLPHALALPGWGTAPDRLVPVTGHSLSLRNQRMVAAVAAHVAGVADVTRR